PQVFGLPREGVVPLPRDQRGKNGGEVMRRRGRVDNFGRASVLASRGSRECPRLAGTLALPSPDVAGNIDVAGLLLGAPKLREGGTAPLLRPSGLHHLRPRHLPPEITKGLIA